MDFLASNLSEPCDQLASRAAVDVDQGVPKLKYVNLYLTSSLT
jgi:hypothetical protein